MVPIGEEEAGMGQLFGLVQDAEPWLAAAAAVHSSVHLFSLVILFCFLHLIPIHRTAAAKNLCTAAAVVEIGEVGYLLV